MPADWARNYTVNKNLTAVVDTSYPPPFSMLPVNRVYRRIEGNIIGFSSSQQGDLVGV
jgi:hypothetical protein